MEIDPLEISGAWMGKSKVLLDERGFFREWFKSEDLTLHTNYEFLTQQANISKSRKGTVRGIHYSLAEQGQAKWITCVTGSILDIVIDIRVGSPTYRKWIGVNLSAETGNSVLIGEGLGHAFLSLEDNTTVSYLLTTPYSPKEEFEIDPFDPNIGIDWGYDRSQLNVAEKDRLAPTLLQRKTEGKLPTFKNK